MSIPIGLPPPEGGSNPFSMAMLGELTQDEFNAVSENMANSMVEAGAPFSQDQIIDYLSFIRDHGISFEAALLVALESDNPLLPAPRRGFQAPGQGQGLSETSESEEGDGSFEESALRSATPASRQQSENILNAQGLQVLTGASRTALEMMGFSTNLPTSLPEASESEEGDGSFEESALRSATPTPRQQSENILNAQGLQVLTNASRTALRSRGFSTNIPTSLPEAEVTGGLTPAERSADRNRWFDPSPQTAFMISYFSLMVALQEVKKQEAELGIQMMNMMMETAQDIADLIKKSAKIEAKMHMAAAISAIVQGSITVGGAALGGLAGIKAGRGARAESLAGAANPTSKSARAMANTRGFTKGMETMSSFTHLASGIGQFATAGEKFATAKLTIDKGKVDAQKAIMETYMKIAERAMSSAFEAYRSSDEQIAQILNNLKEILSKVYQAHDMRLR